MEYTYVHSEYISVKNDEEERREEAIEVRSKAPSGSRKSAEVRKKVQFLIRAFAPSYTFFSLNVHVFRFFFPCFFFFFSVKFFGGENMKKRILREKNHSS